MKNLTWQNPEQLFVAQELINKVKSKCCGIKDETNLNGKFMNKRKLRVLNPAEMRPLTGGTDTTYKCNKSGDTIICGFPADVKACINLEGKN